MEIRGMDFVKSPSDRVLKHLERMVEIEEYSSKLHKSITSSNESLQTLKQSLSIGALYVDSDIILSLGLYINTLNNGHTAHTNKVTNKELDELKDFYNVLIAINNKY